MEWKNVGLCVPFQSYENILQLSRLFSKEVGTSFIDFLVSYRIRCAQQMVFYSNPDLKSIGEQAGFHSYNYYLRAYKEKPGIRRLRISRNGLFSICMFWNKRALSPPQRPPHKPPPAPRRRKC